MIRPPEIEKRKENDILEQIHELVPFYVPEWEPIQKKGTDTVLLKIFSTMIDIITQRLNKTPDKNLIAFLDMLGKKLLPPQPARVPLTFILSEGAKQNVIIPKKTQAIAGKVFFETEKTFVATPSKIARIYSVSSDHIFAVPNNIITSETPIALSSELMYSAKKSETSIFLKSTMGLEEEDIIKVGDDYSIVTKVKDTKVTLTQGVANSAGTSVEKITKLETFQGKDLQEHILYLGHSDLFNIKGESTIVLDLNIDLLADPRFVQWEFFGEKDKKEDWYPLNLSSDGSKIYLTVEAGTITECEVNGIKSRWIRCKLKVGFTDIPAAAAVDILTSRTESVEGGMPVRMVQGIGEKFLSRLIDLDDPIDTVEKLLTYDADALKGILDCPKFRAINILEAARKQFYDKTNVLNEYGSGGSSSTSGSSSGSETDAAIKRKWIRPDMAFYNDVPIDLAFKEDQYPFGVIPRTYNTFYIASQEAFSKKMGSIYLHFKGSIASNTSPQYKPQLSFEYFNGNGWVGLKNVSDNTDSFTKLKNTYMTIEFDAPEDIEETEVNGNKNYWIRIKLVGGDYGKEIFILSNGKYEAKKGCVTPPKLSMLKVSYFSSAQQSLEHCITYNNLTYKDVTDEAKSPDKTFSPFETLGDERNMLYLGFDKKPEKGPISIFFDIVEPKIFVERVRLEWEYTADNDGTPVWHTLETLDGTNGFVQSGTVEIVFSDDFVKTKRFGEELYWIRAIDVDNKYMDNKEVPKPVIKGISLNATWCTQSETIKDELLGSSNGNTNQKFILTRYPVISSEVWVNEINSLSEGERAKMLLQPEPLTKEVKGEDGNTSGFWVRWSPVNDILTTSKDDRKYEIDLQSGYIIFGDSVTGMIPPIGIDNIKATYSTGGGYKGNTGIAEINALNTSIAFVDKVLNTASASGGSEKEAVEDAIKRGCQHIHNRGRAITQEDYENLVNEASRDVARVKCMPNTDNLWEPNPGWVTIIIVPSTNDNKPLPSLQLRHQVKMFIKENMSGTVSVPERLHVSGPLYVKVSVNTKIIAKTMADIPFIEKDANSLLKQFLHPLKGGYQGKGWEFGRLPYFSDFYLLLERIKGVDHVSNLSVKLHDLDSNLEFSLSSVDENTTIQANKLIFSGIHKVSVMTDKNSSTKNEGA